jgi:hypothetical protein
MLCWGVQWPLLIGAFVHLHVEAQTLSLVEPA